MYLYSIDGNELTLKETLDYGGEVSAISYSPTGAYLAVSGGARKTFVYDTSTYKVMMYVQYTCTCRAEYSRNKLMFIQTLYKFTVNLLKKSHEERLITKEYIAMRTNFYL